MSAKTFIVCGLSFAAFVFLGICYGIHRRVTRARLELRRRRWDKAVAHAYEIADDSEQTILGVG